MIVDLILLINPIYLTIKLHLKKSKNKDRGCRNRQPWLSSRNKWKSNNPEVKHNIRMNINRNENKTNRINRMRLLLCGGHCWSPSSITSLPFIILLLLCLLTWNKWNLIVKQLKLDLNDVHYVKRKYFQLDKEKTQSLVYISPPPNLIRIVCASHLLLSSTWRHRKFALGTAQ